MQWPRELYLHVLGCKALVPPPYGVTDGVTDVQQHQRLPSGESLDSSVSTATATTGVSRGTEGDAAAGDVDSNKGGVMKERGGGDNGTVSGGVVEVSVAEEDLGVENAVRAVERVQIAGADSYSSTDDDLEEGGVNNGVGGPGEAAESEVTVAGGGGWEEEEQGECFVRISNATTGRDLQV